GAIMVFIFSFTDLGTPLIFGYRPLLPVRIFSYLSDIEATNEAYVLVMVVLVLTSVLFLVSKRIMGRRSYAMMARASSSAVERPVGRTTAALIWIGFAVVMFAALVPHVGVVLTSVTGRWFDTPLPETFTLDHYSNALGHKLTVPAIRNSLVLSLVATCINVVLGIFIAWVVVRKRPWFADLLDTLVMLPLALPGIVLAFGYLRCFDGVPLLDPGVNPMPLLAIAYAVRRLPYVVRAAVAGLQQTSETLEEASVNLGASPLRTVTRITIPLVLANLISGAILAFSFAMLEVSDSLILARTEQYYPITKAIYDLFARLDDGPYIASALGVWAMVFLALSLVAASVAMGKKMGQIFRA
ncbi:MAG: ABC transporter permease, partial [Planctomycetota bacterium]